MVLHAAYFSAEFYCLGSQHEGLSKKKKNKKRRWWWGSRTILRSEDRKPLSAKV